MSRRNWKRVQATSLRHALELCKDHAREVKRLSVERIAELMGEDSHWTVYGWLRDGSIPGKKIVAYQHACGCDYITRWLAATEGKLIVEIPSGRNVSESDVIDLHRDFNLAMEHLVGFYAGKASAEDTLAALTQLMQDMAWHQRNVATHGQPELELINHE